MKRMQEIDARIQQLEEKIIMDNNAYKLSGHGLAIENLMKKYPTLLDGQCKVMNFHQMLNL